MKRKTRFPDGGATGRFDEDVYERARRYLRENEGQGGMDVVSDEGDVSKTTRRNPETGELYSSSLRRNEETGEMYSTEPVSRPKPHADTEFKPASGSGRAGRGATAEDMAKLAPRPAEIPETVSRGDTVGKTSAERAESEIRDNVMKALAATGIGGAGAVGLGRLMAAKRAREASLSKEAAKRFASPQARQVGSQVTTRPSQVTKETAKAMESAKPVLQARKSDKAARASRARRTEEDAGIEFSRGGSTASKRADGIAQRGKTRGRMY